MADFFVDGAGSDTSGNGSLSAPWKSLTRALQAIPDAPCTIHMAAGVYAEKSATLNYLYINRGYSSTVVVEPLHEGAAVVITDAQAAAGLYTVRFGNARNLLLRGLTFQMAHENTKPLIYFQNTSCSNIVFENCAIEPMAKAADHIAIGLPAIQNAALTGLAFRNCRIRPAPGSRLSVQGFVAPVGLNGLLDVVFDSCSIEGAGDVLTVFGYLTDATGQLTLTLNNTSVLSPAGSGVQVRGGTLLIDDSSIAAYRISTTFGVNGVETYKTYGHIQGSYCSSSTSHGLLIGAGSTNVEALHNTVHGGDQGLVVKECSGALVEDNNITAGTISGLMFKAVTHGTARRNTILSRSGQCLQVKFNQSNQNKPCDHITLTDNVAVAKGSALCLWWGDDTNDAGGGICDRNTYIGQIGVVRERVAATLTELQAAWAGYDVAGNDLHSVIDVWD